jgi:hypothetical protein
VHLDVILVNDELDALFLNVFILCLYIFREASAHHQEGQIVLIRQQNWLREGKRSFECRTNERGILPITHAVAILITDRYELLFSFKRVTDREKNSRQLYKIINSCS